MPSVFLHTWKHARKACSSVVVAVDKRARALSAGARTKHNYGMSAQRPQSARPAFSSAEYEEAKRRVRRLDATVAGVGAGAAERRDAAPLRADGARPAAGSAAGAAGTESLPLPTRKARSRLCGKPAAQHCRAARVHRRSCT